MKLLSGQSMKRNQSLRLGKKIGSSSSSSTSVAIFGGQEKKTVMGYVPKKLVYKFKSQLKQAAIGFQNKDRSTSAAKYTYDIHSYSLNFDDGLCR